MLPNSTMPMTMPGVYGRPVAQGGAMPQWTPGYPSQPRSSWYPSNAYYQPAMTTPTSWMPQGPVMTPAGPLAQSFPMGPLPPLPAIQPPDQAAPCLFNTHVPYGYGYTPPGMTNFYNYNTAPYYPWAQQPQSPPPQQQPPQQPPQPGAQQLDPNKPPQPPQPEQKKPEELPKPVTDAAVLTPEKVREINTALASGDSVSKMQAAMQLAKIIDADPDILTKPQYKQFAEALILKALRNPDSLVHQPILISLEVGNLNAATPAIINQLNQMKANRGLYNFEPGMIERALNNLKMKALEGPSGTAGPNGINPAVPQQQPAANGQGPSKPPAAAPLMPPGPRSSADPSGGVIPGMPESGPALPGGGSMPEMPDMGPALPGERAMSGMPGEIPAAQSAFPPGPSGNARPFPAGPMPAMPGAYRGQPGMPDPRRLNVVSS